MKKEDIAGLFVYLILLGLAIVFGLTVLNGHAKESFISNAGNFAYMGFMLGAIVIGLVFNATLFELAHALGAKVGGYEVSSVNILGLTFYKNEKGKTKIKFSGFDGLTGETKIYPKENLKDKKGNAKESSPYAYLWFGSLFILLEVVVVMVCFSVMTRDPGSLLADWAYFILTGGAIGVLILLYNILPFKLDTPTDGYKLTLVSNPKNKAAFNELLRVQRAAEEGKEIEIKTFTEITNYTANLNLNKVYQLLDKRDFANAEPLLDMIIKARENISYNVYLRARAQKIYINLMNKPLEEAKEYYEKEVPANERRDISTDISMPSIRVYLLMSGLLDRSKSECLIALNNVIKAYKKTPKTRQKTEIELFNETLDKVCAAHPKWELDGYKLSVQEEKK